MHMTKNRFSEMVEDLQDLACNMNDTDSKLCSASAKEASCLINSALQEIDDFNKSLDCYRTESHMNIEQFAQLVSDLKDLTEGLESNLHMARNSTGRDRQRVIDNAVSDVKYFFDGAVLDDE